MLESKKKIHFEMPHRNILVLAAVCISVIAISLAYKVSAAEKESRANLSSNILGEQGDSDQVSQTDKRIADALNEAQMASLGDFASSSNPFDPTPKDSISDRFSKDIFAAYQKYEASGEQLNLDDLSSDTINNINTDSLPKAKYALSDISSFVPKNNDEIKDYGNTFAKMYVQTVAPVSAHPEIYNTSLKALGGIYRGLGEGIMKIKVPNEIAEQNLELANGFVMMADAFPLVDGQEKDPVKALLGLRVIKDSMENQAKMFTEINDYFQQNGIIFGKDDIGSIWNTIQANLSNSQ